MVISGKPNAYSCRMAFHTDVLTTKNESTEKKYNNEKHFSSRSLLKAHTLIFCRQIGNVVQFIMETIKIILFDLVGGLERF
jgi:hypothetical protein